MIREIIIILIAGVTYGEYICYNHQEAYAPINPTNCTWEDNSVDEIDGLMSMYEGMGGEYWYIKDNWGNISESYCNWAGISCNEKCRVDKIIFIANNLTGEISEKIYKLQEVNYLQLVCNYITGGLSYLTELYKLELLDLTYNFINDIIPNDIGNLVDLNAISLSDNFIHGSIPKSIGNLELLTYINLADNNLNGTIPIEFSMMKELSDILISNNPLLTGDIEYILINMNKLAYLEMSNCNFTGRLPVINSTVDFGYINFRNNNFEGDIPVSWGNIKSVPQIYIGRNKISGGLKNVLFIPELYLLDVSYNSFEGVFPVELMYTTVNKLMAEGNNFNGPLPSYLGNLVLVNITDNPRTHETNTYSDFIFPQYQALTNFGTYECAAYQQYSTLVFCDPTFYGYKWCRCVDDSNGTPPSCQ